MQPDLPDWAIMNLKPSWSKKRLGHNLKPGLTKKGSWREKKGGGWGLKEESAESESESLREIERTQRGYTQQQTKHTDRLMQQTVTRQTTGRMLTFENLKNLEKHSFAPPPLGWKARGYMGTGIYSMDWNAGMEWWNGLDWNGMEWNSGSCPTFDVSIQGGCYLRLCSGCSFGHACRFREFHGHVAIDRVPSVGSATLDSLAHGMACSDSTAVFLYNTIKLHKESW